MDDILGELGRRQAGWGRLPAGNQALARPYVIRKRVCGVTFAMVMGDELGRHWYDKPERAGADGVQAEQATELEFIAEKQLTGPGGVVFDVGAHQGYHALVMASWVGAGGHVYAFEPLPHNADLIELNARLNGLGNVTVVRAAVGDVSGTVKMELALEQMVARPGHEGDEGITVQAVRLDDFADKRPTFLKIDAEGWELKVLDGARQVLATGPNLDLEVHAIGTSHYGIERRDTLSRVDWSRYECWICEEQRPEFRPWQPADGVADQHCSWIYARAR